MDMPKIMQCTATQCAYNQEKQCHALAITIGDATHPHCDTFFEAPMKGGDPAMTGSVGACKVDICRFNESFECHAQGIQVGFLRDDMDCQTFNPK